jgi:hypothetical protein
MFIEEEKRRKVYIADEKKERKQTTKINRKNISEGERKERMPTGEEKRKEL